MILIPLLGGVVSDPNNSFYDMGGVVSDPINGSRRLGCS